MQAYESWQAGARQRQKQKERAAKQRPTEGDSPQKIAAETSWEASFDPLEPSKDFSFAGNYVNVSKEDVDNEIARLAQWSGVDERILAALKRGIGVHHAGMNKGYRGLVERYLMMISGEYSGSLQFQLVPSGVSPRGNCYRYVS